MDPIDIAFIGSGIATTVSMIEVLTGIQDNPSPPATPITIAIIESHQQFWRGIPYGSRSSVNALTITSVHDFINETERPDFFQWLTTTRPEWTALYREQVLSAFRDVEDQLSALRVLEQEATVTGRAVESAKRSTELSTMRYKRGLATYLEVLTAQTIELANERTAASLVTERIIASAQLQLALGGGWDAAQLPKD